MKIVILDAKTLGSDIDLIPISKLGDVVTYDLTEQDQVKDRVKEADVILTNKVILNESSIGEAKNLKFIGLFATGYNNVDLDYAKERGIGVANVAGYSTQSVAQHTFALLFNLIEKLDFYNNYVKSKAYTTSDTFAFIEKPFWEINRKTWGIIGMGAIGQEVAKIAEVFGAKVVYYSTSGANNAMPYQQVDLETLLSTSDIVSIHAPLNDKTKNLITYKEMKKMKKHAVLLNLGRGSIVNEEDLAKALNEEVIQGAGLDVLTHEPIEASNPLYSVKDSTKWLVTPHIAWASIEARQTLVKEVVQNIEAYFSGNNRNRLV